MKDIKMKIKNLALLFVLSGVVTALQANPITAFMLAQNYQRQLNDQQLKDNQCATSKNLKVLKRKKEKSAEHYAMVFQAMQKAVDLH